MSVNQFKSVKNESHYRKAGAGSRSAGFGQQRNFPGGGGGSSAPPLVNNPPPVSANRSVTKTSNGQGVQSRVTTGPVQAAAGVARAPLQNGSHSQPNSHAPAVATKPHDASAQRNTWPVPNAPISQPPAVISASTATPTTPAKGDGAKGIALQFGSLSPGFMNCMQVPARTTSAPPNLDEQKQAQHGASKGASTIPIASAPKPQLPRKDSASVPQHNSREINKDMKANRDAPVTSAPQALQSQKPAVLPLPKVSRQMQYTQPSAPMKFGGPNPQMPPSQGMPTMSLPIPMQMPVQMGNPPPMQQPLFIQGLQHPIVQPQGIMHMSQGMGFNPQMSHHPQQLGTLGMNLPPPQFSPQQAAKYSSPHKTVKITHPETREELRLDKRSDAHGDGASASKTHNTALPQHYTSGHPISNPSKPYSAAPSYVVAPSGSLPLNSAQLNPVTQQSARLKYPVTQAPHAVSSVNQSAPDSVSVSGTIALGTIESSTLDSSRVTQNVVSSLPVSVTINPAAHSSTEKGTNSKPVEQGEKQRASRSAEVVASSNSRKDYQVSADNLSHSSLGFEQLNPSTASAGVNATDVTASSLPASRVESSKVNMNDKKQDVVVSSYSAKENCKKPVLKGHAEMQHQVGIHVSSASGLSQAVEGGDGSSTTVSSLSVESKTDLPESQADRGTGVASIEQLSAVTAAPVDDISSGAGVILDRPACSASDVVGAAVGVGTEGLDCCAELQKLPPHVEASGAENHAEMTNIRALGDKMHLETSSAEQCIHAVSHDGNTETSGTSLETAACMNGIEAVTEVYSSDHKSEVISAHIEVSGSILRPGEGMETSRPNSSSGSVSNSVKASAESHKTKSTLLRGKKKIKQVLQQADALGTTSDLYGAYKGPEEKKERNSSEHTEIPSSDNSKPVSGECNGEDASIKEKLDESKAEPEDWEEAADVSSPKLLSINKDRELIIHHGEEDGTAKKYSRDFLLTFSEQYIDLPEGFGGIISAFADILSRPKSSSSRVVDRECPTPGRPIDRTSRGPKVDQRGSGMMDADRWSKQTGQFPSPRDIDPGSGSMSMGFRPGQGSNHGVLRNTRGQQPVQNPILSGPAHMQRSNSDADRWRNMNFRGLMPPPQIPMPSMHKAEKRYEVGKVTDEEQVKQRKLKGILNKLTPQNFDKLFAQVKEVNIDNVITLSGVISQIFDKALMEPTFCEMYADFCYQLSLTLPELTVEEEKVTFKRLLLNKCQEEFERGEREEEEASKVDNQDETKLSDKEREEKRLKARRHMLGNIRLIGELYKKRMLTERIMHECIQKLLREFPNSDEEDIESLCKLMSTIGEMIDHAKSKEHMDYYFGMVTELSNNMNLSSRVRFMLKDAIDLRKNKWQQRRKVEGPKKIDDVHRDAAQERQGQVQAARLNRATSMGSGMRRGQHVDFGPRGSSALSSPVGQMGSFRGSPQVRSYGMQDMRNNERNSFDSRTISVPLPQRSSSDNSITLGPQGGLARGMSSRGQPLVDNSRSHGEVRRNAGGVNGFSSMSERPSFNSREDSHPRYTPPERYGGSKSSMQDPAATTPLNRDHINVDHNSGSVIAVSTPGRVQGTLTDQNLSSEKVWPEEQLRKKSIATIREFYSAKDEKEVDMCVRELNAPSLYPSVISIWVTDSFDRKELERDLLNGLIVNLSKPRDGRLFVSEQLIKGFEAVLANLEDTVNDAPKAPDYLGRLFASLISANVVSLQQIGGLIYEGGEEPGRLREEGLAGDILGSILENVKSKEGDAAVKHMCTSSKLRLQDFQPPNPLRSRKLEQFIP